MQEEALERRYAFRHYAPTVDISPLAGLLTSVDAVDHDGEDTSEAALQEQLTWPNHHPEQDCWVIENPTATHDLIGYCSVYAQTAERSTLYVIIHPNWRRKGLGSALLTKALKRARELKARQVTIYANAQNMAANAFLGHHGFRLVGASWVLLAPLDIVLEAIHWPAGYTVDNAFAESLLPALVEVMNCSYADTWGHAENDQATTEEDARNWLNTSDQKGLFLVFAPDGSIAGFCRAIRATEPKAPDALGSAAPDQLEQPGVVPEHRHQELYRPLALTALHWLRSNRSRDILLQSWGDTEQTIALYRSIGFTQLQHFLAYQQEFF